ncbi:ABC transporter ATP-binding protein [Streptomyces sp. GQFP]|uniref:ABC transporter ATP-binding protein n=1 Tax=Streptomyces sp. GQFP TaxID=2907545 RepID=UPI001F2CA187|nr:ABC transporter ATP-binding protein [Streptomyces sp. GQFP]UIX29191.1 ABC transporter ATP-binding protein [Streptomyces sp. GQFP]
MSEIALKEATTPDQREEDVTPPLLAVTDLTVRYGASGPRPVTALDGVSLTIARGERIALVGESGSGKTTMGLAIAGFLTGPDVEITAGTVTFDGATLARTERSGVPRRTPGMSMMFQDAMTSLDPVWTIGSQLRAVLRANDKLTRKEQKDRAREWLTRVGLTDTDRVMKARPYELSGGMRQRAMLALALAGGPQLLIADEPTSALDASLSREAMELLVELTDDFGASLLIVSHDIHLCQDYADRTMVMYGGRIVEHGDSRTLAETATHPYTVGLLRCIPTLDSANLDELPTLARVAAELAATGAER